MKVFLFIAIMTEAVEVNKLKISVDKDGDGKVDSEEVIDY